MNIDPVCRMKVLEDHALSAEYEGKTYYFCSEGCRGRFFHAHPRKEHRSACDLTVIGGGRSALPGSRRGVGSPVHRHRCRQRPFPARGARSRTDIPAGDLTSTYAKRIVIAAGEGT